jgi:hypothetical protein
VNVLRLEMEGNMRSRFLTARVAVAAVALGGLVGFAPAAGAASGTHVCSGTFQNPGVLVGTYNDVSVQGVCAVPAGPAVVRGNLSVSRGSVIVAAFGMNHSRLEVHGDLWVEQDGGAVLGCNTTSSSCIDDPNPDHPTLSSHATVRRNLIGQGALGILAHNADVWGDFLSNGGGGGVNCDPHGFFNQFQSPAFSTFEDGSIGGNVRISNVRSCWMGFNRVNVAGSVAINNNQLADPDAIEILGNHISGNLSCAGNSMVWDSFDVSENLFPREYSRNTVGGTRGGQCRLDSPTSPSDQPGPGAF